MHISPFIMILVLLAAMAVGKIHYDSYRYRIEDRQQFTKKWSWEAKATTKYDTIITKIDDVGRYFNRKEPFWITYETMTNNGFGNKVNNPGCWKLFPLQYKQKSIDENMKAVPNIAKYVKETGPYILAALSLLSPGCKILPHTDDCAEREACHIGLVSNKDSFIAIDGVKINHSLPGKQICFNQWIKHSAENNGKNDRITLYLRKP